MGFPSRIPPSSVWWQEKVVILKREASEFFKSSCQKTADYPGIPAGDAADFAYCDLFFTSADFEFLSSRTSGASKNRDYWSFFLVLGSRRLSFCVTLTNFLMNFFSKDFFLTFNLLTIASFRIGVPSILFYIKKNDWIKSSALQYALVQSSAFGSLINALMCLSGAKSYQQHTHTHQWFFIDQKREDFGLIFTKTYYDTSTWFSYTFRKIPVDKIIQTLQ